MNSFALRAVGNLARNPEVVSNDIVTVIRFCLVGQDQPGKDEPWAPREISTSLWFYAFDQIATSILANARKSDQLILEARLSAANKIAKDGNRLQEVDFIVTGLKYGARNGGGSTGAAVMRCPPPPSPLSETTAEVKVVMG